MLFLGVAVPGAAGCASEQGIHQFATAAAIVPDLSDEQKIVVRLWSPYIVYTKTYK